MDISANENNKTSSSNVALTSSENMENCNLSTTPPPTAQTIPSSSTSAPSLDTVANNSNDMSNQETDLLAAMMSEEEKCMQQNSATSSTLTSATTSMPSDVNVVATSLTNNSNTNDDNEDERQDSTTTTTMVANTEDPSADILPSAALVSSVTSATSSASSHTSNQFVTPQKPNENKSILLAAGSASLPQHQKKKKRNKSSKCLGGGGGHNMHGGRGHDSSSSLSNIKTSLSMTSLPPDEQQENRDGINAKLKAERPYNSLKKNSDRNLTNQLGQMQRASNKHGNSNNYKHHRYSWGSGHSSSSLHSSAATLGIGSGKDDLWAAIQTNYNYIMDTNLLDTCKEARCEIEGATSVLNNTNETCLKMLEESIPSVGSCEDPKELRKWLRDMEHKLESAPTLSEATMLSCAELQKHLTEHSVLYHEIVSHARIVSACIRAASEKEQQQQQQLQLQQQQQLQHNQDSDASLIAEQTNSSLSSTDDTATTSSGIVCCSTESNKLVNTPSSPTAGANSANHNSSNATTPATTTSHSRKSELSLERLQNRYHLLYLKAFEVQLWLDGLLRKKSSSVDNLTNEDLDSDDIDDSIDDTTSDDSLDGHNDHRAAIGGATEDDLNDLASDLESDIRHNSLSYNEDLQQQQQHQQHLDNRNGEDISNQTQHHPKHQRSNTSDIDEEKQTLNIVSSHHSQQRNKHHHQVHLLQKASRDCIQTKLDFEDEGDDEEEEEEDNNVNDDDDDEEYLDTDIDEIDCPQQQPQQQRKQRGYTKLLVTFDRSTGGRSSAAGGNNSKFKTNLTLSDFEADSESSDLETIQQRIRNQRGAFTVGGGKGLLTTTYKYLIANGSFSPNQAKRYNAFSNNNHHTKTTTTSVAPATKVATSSVSGANVSCSLDTAANEVVVEEPAIENNTTELESCEINDMQTKATAADLLVNAKMVANDHLHLPSQQQQLKVLHQQQLHNHQRLTLMAITQNGMTTATTTGSTANSSGSLSSSSSSGALSGCSINGSNSNSSSTSGIIDNHTMQHKLSSSSSTASDNNQQQHHQQNNLANGVGVGAGGIVGLGGIGGNSGLTMKQKNIAIISPNNSHNGTKASHHHHPHQHPNKLNNKKSPTVLRKHYEHHHAADISKFNRSNRKSKNCAIFYFKHLDTDNETNYSNSQCGDDVHDVVGGSGGDGDINNVNDGRRHHRGTLSSSAASSHASDLLKSAEVSSDDEGWLYTAASQQQQQHQPRSVDVVDIESLNSNHISRGISAVSSELYSYDHLAISNNAAAAPGSIQSSTVSSSTSAAIVAATVAASLGATIYGDGDSDKENKEAVCATTTTTTNLTTIHLQTSAAATTTVHDTDVIVNATTTITTEPNNSAVKESSSGSSSSSSITSSSCSSNDMLTEATTTTTTGVSIKTSATKIRSKYHQRQEMELQINNNHGNDHHQYNNNNNNNNNGKSPTSTSMQHIVSNSNNNNNCVSTNSRHKTFNSNNNTTALSAAASSSTASQQQHNRNSSFSDDAVNGNLEKGKVSHESIKQLVLEAEHLVRDEALKTPTKQKHSINCGGLVQISSTIKKREVSIMPGPIKRVQEWLEHQPSTPVQLKSSQDHQLMASPSSIAASPSRTDDCEASGEASETDSIPQHCSDDTSEGFTESIATCMQTSTNSYGNSTERMGGSAEPMVVPGSNQSLNVKVIKRQQSRRKSERPWSVSCLSQLTTDAKQVAAKVSTISNVQSGLASHSISESALDSLSPGRPRTSSTAAQVKSYDSKGSLKRRKTRKKKLSYNTNGKKSDTNSEDNLEQTELNKHNNSSSNNNNNMILSSCESMTPQQMAEITQALLQLQNSNNNSNSNIASTSEQLINNCPTGAATSASNAESGEEENHLMKPNFRVGSFTTAYMTNEARLGSLAKLATYMNDEELQGEYTTGTEDHHSSFSETAWDNYQEKYNSENYSEGFDSDAARKLLEFGDDYRNFIDSQSDCCSSLSAANNLDSLSPPRMDSLQQNETKIVITQDTIVSSVDHARRRRALELEYERRRKNLEIRRKSCQESLDYPNPKSPTIAQLSSSTQALTPKNSERFNFQQHKLDSATRKLEFGMSHSAQSLRRTSESDTSQRRRKADERRRSSRNLEKCIKLIPATSSSSGDDSDDEKEIRNLLQQSQNRLDDTKALKIRCHLLRPEDYTEIINTCRDNIRCLESVLKGPSSSVLSAQCVTQSKDLLAAWEDLLGWSENAAAARKMQEDMIVLKHALNRLGNKSSYEQLDTEPSIQIAIEALKNEKTQLQTYRTSMLKLNASVHSWLTKQERRLQNAVVEQQLKEAAAKVGSIELLEEKDEIESEHKQAVVVGITASSIATEPDSTTTATNKTTMITVTDSNGNQVETHTTNATMMTTSASSVGTSTTTQTIVANEKNWDLQSLITSENEFHKHLKDEVSDMYTAWDEADSRINSQLEVLTSSLTAWRQLECGLSEFQLALGQDRGTLQGLEGALKTGQATPGELAQNVKLVAKLLSEKVNVSQEQLTAVQDYLDPNHVLYIAKFTASNGSLSDSGISDGGATSDGGLSERERRLGVLRRLAKQLESALAPGSEAMKSIAARMESAENDLKSLQNTCRDLIVRTAASHQSKKQQSQEQVAAGDKKDQTDSKPVAQLKHANGCLKGRQQMTNGYLNGLDNKVQFAAVEGVTSSAASPSSSMSRRKRKNRRSSATAPTNAVLSADMAQSNAIQMSSTNPDGDDDPSDDNSNYDLDSSDDELNPKSKRGWAWRIARVAVPMQLALFTVFCAACLMQPNCCDNINNLSMSFTPQLRYVRGPPPI
ncbi:klarsicht isoform X3 [Musca autumnalis]|uniref:klarsicht isoform X3 n=1 Tax=Musca autumnalis TaxID=221902 RepID=UPI003CFADA3F